MTSSPLHLSRHSDRAPSRTVDRRFGGRRSGYLFLPLILALASGCANLPLIGGMNSNSPSRPAPVTIVHANDFRATPADTSPAPLPLKEGSGGGLDSRSAATSAISAIPTERPVTTTSSPPDGIAPAPADPSTMIVGGLVGQVNGRPIYVDEFFAPIADELAIDGRRARDSAEFVRTVLPKINKRLITIVQNELLYSEARSSLTEQERVGLQYFMDSLRNDIIRREGGSETVASRQLQSRHGTDVDEQVEQETRSQLIGRLVSEKIGDRAVVTWRDIVRYYREHDSEFHPPPGIQLRVLTLPASDSTSAVAVETALAEGRSFDKVAEQHSTSLASRGGLMPAMTLDPNAPDSRLTRWPAVDAAARTLKQGQYAGPIKTDDDTLVWVFVEKYETGRARTLYEAQHEIEQKIRDDRLREAERKYFLELQAKGRVDDPERMTLKLIDVALSRWGPPVSP